MHPTSARGKPCRFGCGWVSFAVLVQTRGASENKHAKVCRFNPAFQNDLPDHRPELLNPASTQGVVCRPS